MSPAVLILLTIALTAVLVATLGRGHRATEGRMLAAIVPLLIVMASVLLVAKGPDLQIGSRVNLNAPDLDAGTLADATGTPLDLARRVLTVRDRLPRHAFRSLEQIPSLGRAPRDAVEQLNAWAKSRRWAELRHAAATGSLGAEFKSRRRAGGLFPSLDIQTRAAALLPTPPFLLSRSDRSALFTALGSTAIADRIVQYRIEETAQPKTLSEVPAIPKTRITLQSPERATRLFEGVVALLLALLIAGHLYLRRAMPDADALLWPVFGGLATLGVMMLFAVVPPLTARGTNWPLVGLVPEYAGQGFAVAIAMLALPAAPAMLRFSERVGRRWIGGALGAAILIPNVLAQFGWAGLALIAALVVAAGAMFLTRMTAAENRGLTARGIAGSGALIVLIGLTALTIARLAGGTTGYAPLVETAKILLVLFTARICTEYELFLGEGLRGIPKRALWELAGCWAAAMVLAILADDLGLLLLLWLPFTLLLSLSIGNAMPVVTGLAGMVLGSAALVASGHTRFPERLSGWLDPWNAASTQMAEVYQRMASVPSILAGDGLGHGTRLAVSTDTRDVILPLYFEHLGWIGIAIVTLMLLAGIHRLFRVGLRARDPYAQWTSLGFACVLAVQTTYMIGADFGALPLTGLTLAPIASGKAAAFFTLVMAWLVLCASAQPEGVFTPERRRRARFAAAAFAVFAGLALYADGKLIKIAVIDRDENALHPVGGSPNRRTLIEMASLRTGRILARSTGPDYSRKNVIPLAYSQRNDAGDEIRRYPAGTASFPVVGARDGRHAIGGEAEWRRQLTGLDAFVDRAEPMAAPGRLEEGLLLHLWRRQSHPLWPREERIAPQDVQTTLVDALQRSAYSTLARRLESSHARTGNRPRKGAMLLVDVRTGEVLAYAQFPSANPSSFTGGWAAWDRMATDPSGFVDPNGAMVDLVRHTDRAPGSTAKINTMMALADAGGADRTFRCGPGVVVNGQSIRDFHDENHGTVSLRTILKYSCNRGAAQAAQLVGWPRLLSQYRTLRYSLPHMPRPDVQFRQEYQQIAFGQAISVSLWELATSVCAVARGGEAIELHMVRRPRDMVERWRVCSRASAARVAEGMRAVAEPGGTGWAVYRGLHDWPSKTGSAEVVKGAETDAWFVGYAPRVNPAIAFVVWAEEDGTGSGLAKAIDLSALIERDLHVMGISEGLAPGSASRWRGRTGMLRAERGRAGPDVVDRIFGYGVLARPRQLLNDLEAGVRRATRGVDTVRRQLDRLSR